MGGSSSGSASNKRLHAGVAKSLLKVHLAEFSCCELSKRMKYSFDLSADFHAYAISQVTDKYYIKALIIRFIWVKYLKFEIIMIMHTFMYSCNVRNYVSSSYAGIDPGLGIINKNATRHSKKKAQIIF